MASWHDADFAGIQGVRVDTSSVDTSHETTNLMSMLMVTCIITTTITMFIFSSIFFLITIIAASCYFVDVAVVYELSAYAF